MAENATLLAVDDEPLLPPKPPVADPHFDITAMVDLVFMMNIFFLVTWVTTALAEIDLPAARHVVAADPENCIVITILDESDGQGVLAFLGEPKGGERLTDGPAGDEQIYEAVERGHNEGKDTVLIKAEKDVLLRDLARIAGAATASGDMKLNLAVIEKD